MKTTTIFLLGVAVAATMNANSQALASSQDTRLDVIKQNQALANSPRMKELYPELARSTPASAVVSSQTDQRQSELARVDRNSAWAHSPRVLEQFPELAVSGQPVEKTPADVNTRLAVIRLNPALANSPRMLERFPQLSRENKSEPSPMNAAQVAPLK